MKIKKNHLLTMAVLSLLGISQTVMADPISSTITLNGVTRQVEFASQDQLSGILNATAAPAEQLAFANLFTNPTTGVTPANSAGLVSSSLVNGEPVTLIKATDPVTGKETGTMLIEQPVVQADGSVKPSIVEVQRSTTYSAVQIANEYIKTLTIPGYTSADLALAAVAAQNVKPVADTASLANANNWISKVGAAILAPVALPTSGAITDTSITPITDPVQLAQIKVNQQLSQSAVNAAAQTAATTAVATTKDVTAQPPVPVTTAALDTLTKTPAVQLQAAKDQLTAAQTVATTILASGSALDKNAIAQVQLAAASNVVTATQSALAANVPGVTETDLANANASVTTAQQLVTANPAFGQAALTAQADVATAQTNFNNAKSAYDTAVAKLTPALQQELADLQAGKLTGVAKSQAMKDLVSSGLVSLVKAELDTKNALIAKEQAFIAALQKDPNAASLADAIAAETNKLAVLNGDLLAIKNLIPLDPTAIAAAAKVETSKLVAAVGGGAAKEITDAETALNTAAQGYDPDKANAAAQHLVDLLAQAKTNQWQAKNNSTSGIAGNPASTMNMTIDGMFNQTADFGGTNAASTSNVSGASADIGGVNTSVGVGLQYGYYDIGGKSVNTVTMPLSVTAKFNPKHQLTISVPLSYIQTQSQSDAYQVGVNAAYKYNVTDNWSLTPAASYSYRSFDNNQNQYWNPNSSTSLVGGSVSSKYTWNFSPMAVSLINMVGYFQSLDSTANTTAMLNFGTTNNVIGVGGVVTRTATNNAVSNYVVKNGLHATKTFGSMKVGAYFTDTHYFGSALYFDQFNEFGFSLKPVNAGRMLDALSIDANYLFSIAGKNSGQLDGFRLNLGYKF